MRLSPRDQILKAYRTECDKARKAMAVREQRAFNRYNRQMAALDKAEAAGSVGTPPKRGKRDAPRARS